MSVPLSGLMGEGEAYTLFLHCQSVFVSGNQAPAGAISRYIQMGQNTIWIPNEGGGSPPG